MDKLLYIALGVAGLALVVNLVWRLVSRRHTLPCPVWLGWLVEMDNPFTRVNRAAEILRHLALEPGMTAADIGCGPGRVTLPAARQVGREGRIVAMDIQPGMLERVREKARAEGLSNIELLNAPLGEGALGRDRFDAALMVTVLGEVPDREAALREVYEALKPGGVLSITELIFDPHFQRRSTVTELAKKTGFTQKALHGNRIAYTMHLEKPGQDSC